MTHLEIQTVSRKVGVENGISTESYSSWLVKQEMVYYYPFAVSRFLNLFIELML